LYSTTSNNISPKLASTAEHPEGVHGQYHPFRRIESGRILYLGIGLTGLQEDNLPYLVHHLFTELEGIKDVAPYDLQRKANRE
jgi:hypothetical protein